MTRINSSHITKREGCALLFVFAIRQVCFHFSGCLGRHLQGEVMCGSVGQTKLTANCFQEQFLPGYILSHFFLKKTIGTTPSCHICGYSHYCPKCFMCQYKKNHRCVGLSSTIIIISCVYQIPHVCSNRNTCQSCTTKTIRPCLVRSFGQFFWNRNLTISKY